MFLQASVCLSTWEGAGTPVLGSFQGLWSQDLSGGDPIPAGGGGLLQSFPSQGGTPGQDRIGVPCSQDRTGYPTSQDCDTTPPPKTEQQSKYLPRSTQYVPCGHAGGLSCLLQFCRISTECRWEKLQQCADISVSYTGGQLRVLFFANISH